MSLKSRSIFKNLSGVFLLLLVITAVFIPFEAVKAGPLGDFFSFDIFDSLVEFVAKAATDEDNKFFSVIFYLAYQLFNVCLLAVTILVYFGAWLVDVFLDEAIYARVLDMTDTTSAVYIGWTTVRDACNTFFVLFLLLIAFSTILRVQTYNAKSLLPKFIIALFLINFSATIAMMVIDLGQVFMFEIKTWMGPEGFAGDGSAGSPLTTIVDRFNNNYNYKSPSGSYTIGDVVGVAFAVAYSVILGLLYIMLALFLMVRIIVFVILVIISPFAFFSIILPGMRTYTSQWWQSLVSHAIFGPVFLFFIFLSGKMAQSMQTFEPIEPDDDIKALSYIIAELIPHVVALGMLMAAIPVTQKLGVAGANKFIGGAAGIGKIGIGAVAGAKLLGGAGKKIGGWVGRRAGVDSRKIGDWGREATKRAGGKIPGRVGKRIEGTIILKEAEIKAKDRKNIEEKKGEIKELKGQDAAVAAKGIQAKKLREGESLNKDDEARFIALLEHAASKGENLSDHFSDTQLEAAAQRGADLDSIAKYDPVAAGKMKHKMDSSKTAEEHTEEYMQEHAETGDWKKYSAHVRQNNFDKIQENVDSKELESHIKRSGKKANRDYEIGADKYMQETTDALVRAMGTAGEVAARQNFEIAQEKVRKATGNFEISDADRNNAGYREDTAGNQLDYGKEAASGETVVLHAGDVQKAVGVSGGNDFKKLKKASKIIYAREATDKGAVSGLRLREEDSETLRLMAAELSLKPVGSDSRDEADSHEILKSYMP